MQNHDLLKQLENALIEEKTIYEKIRVISKTQLELIAEKSKDAETLASLMNEKWELIQQVQAVEESHQPIKSSWEEVYTAYDEDIRKTATELKRELLELIGELQTMEDEVAAGLRSQMIDINQQLTLLHKEKKGAKAYFNQRDVRPPRFFDQKN
ncbi:hypothetical protein K8I31_14780 [bacterium]|nr:hypothetical protein [bacterium]